MHERATSSHVTDLLIPGATILLDYGLSLNSDRSLAEGIDESWLALRRMLMPRISEGHPGRYPSPFSEGHMLVQRLPSGILSDLVLSSLA
jgi:hypothetical protein